MEETTGKETFLKAARERESAQMERETIARLGAQPPSDGEARDERTTIRRKSDEIALIKGAAGDVPLGKAVRKLALEGAKAPANKTP